MVEFKTKGKPYTTFDSFEVFCNFKYQDYLKEKYNWGEKDIKDKDTYLCDNADFLRKKYKSREFES
tara:strand:+ start:3174 stop:3371 length:198 start_codon:yes stop_codon:yes gene_type:complete